ncbi:MFS general substrate transporter [Gonapodya prolifera JEL478]|uniref:MFS general substrate transporter n=1 Tax=Gonapodya prolifera (strain JEL478) TaxID=1344416 RepID=A0A139A460_GONPJ|nr:MFS general substrate transporter [Gonapodya prolifera JEL478]|eukprot:KXS11607.1 MFS general substrate transporter [Gonapodya prolifera JEL478]
MDVDNVESNLSRRDDSSTDPEAKASQEAVLDIPTSSRRPEMTWTRFSRKWLFTFDLDDPESLPPIDGAIAWVIVAASFFEHFFMFGLSYSFSVYQRFYVSETSPFFSSAAEAAASNSLVSWVGSVQACCLFLFSPLTGRFADVYGYRTALYVGLVIQALGLLTGSFATSIYHLLPTQGFLYGVGMCISYPPCVGAVTQWHKKLRGVAVGLAVSGAGIGGFAIGPLVQVLIDSVGWRNSLRVMAAIVGGGGALCGFMIVPRQRATPRKGFFDWRILNDSLFFRFFVAGALMNFGYNVPWAFASTVSPGQLFGRLETALTSLIDPRIGVLNGASALGRIMMGLASDAVGPLNALMATMAGATVCVFLIWTFAKSYGVFMLFSVLYGFCAGGFISLTPTAITSMYGVDGIATRMGMYYAGLPWGLLVSPPIAGVSSRADTEAKRKRTRQGAILDRNTQVFPDGTKSQNFVPSILFCAVFLAAGTLGITWVRFERARWKVLQKA